MNVVILLGNIAKVDELKETSGGKKVITFRLGVSNGGKDDSASFFTVEAWEGLAGIVSEYAPVGREVAVEGRLVEDQWKNDAGETRSRVKIVARSINLLRKPGSGAADSSEPVAAVAAGDDEIF